MTPKQQYPICVLHYLNTCFFNNFMFGGTGDPDGVSGDFGRRPLYKMLGYFSLVGLLRLHSLLGDYYQALKVVENMNINKKVCLKLEY